MCNMTLIAKELDAALIEAGRGSATALARTLEVSTPTISRWRQGHISPDRSRWSEIESFFGWPSGHLAGMDAGSGDGAVEAELRMIRERLDEIMAAIKGLTRP